MKSLLRRMHAPIYECRLRELVRLIEPHLRHGDHVLDVGCGFGHLGQALLHARPDLVVEGAESVRREGELIPVTRCEPHDLPWPKDTFDAVIVADVLHHDDNPDVLLRECARVSRRAVIIKDHLREGLLAQQRISLLDWAANAGYNVPCTFRYNDLAGWRKSIDALAGRIQEERTSIDIYPPFFNQFLGKGLHYFAVFEPGASA